MLLKSAVRFKHSSGLNFLPKLLWGGGQGAGGVWEMGEERAGRVISTMADSGIEIQKGKLSLFVTTYIQSKK